MFVELNFKDEGFVMLFTLFIGQCFYQEVV